MAELDYDIIIIIPQHNRNILVESYPEYYQFEDFCPLKDSIGHEIDDVVKSTSHMNSHSNTISPIYKVAKANES